MRKLTTDDHLRARRILTGGVMATFANVCAMAKRVYWEEGCFPPTVANRRLLDGYELEVISGAVVKLHVFHADHAQVLNAAYMACYVVAAAAARRPK